MKNYGAKAFRDKEKFKKLIRLSKSDKYSALQLSKFFCCGRTTILGTLNRCGLHLQNLGRFRKKYHCNEKFFIKLNSVSAYWVGFIAADGTLSNKDKSLVIGLRKSDKNHLQKFLNSIKSNHKIFYTKSNNSVHVYICSSKLFDSLAKLGIHPNKSLRIKNVKIPPHLMSHFILGVYDGDGSLSGKKITHVQFQIAGFKPLLKQIQNVLIKKCKMNRVKIYPLHKNSKASRLQYTGSQIFRILGFIYKDSSKKIRLDRKYNKYITLKKKFNK